MLQRYNSVRLRLSPKVKATESDTATLSHDCSFRSNSLMPVRRH